MKSLSLLLITLSLITIAVFQYLSWAKFDYDKSYDYIIVSDSLDTDYYDRALVEKYFNSVFRIGDLARNAWLHDGIDVKFPVTSNEQHLEAAEEYKRLWMEVTEIEARLKESWRLKQANFTNADIAVMEKQKISERLYQYKQSFEGQSFGYSDVNDGVWDLQLKLNQLGFAMPIDGKYVDLTKEQVQKFQFSQYLYPSGEADDYTLNRLAIVTEEAKITGYYLNLNTRERIRYQSEAEVMGQAASLDQIQRLQNQR